MDTPESEETEKVATSTPSGGLMILSTSAPKIRTIEDLYRKHEQVLDATERGALTPEQVKAINLTLKSMKELGLDLPMQMIGLVQKCKDTGDGKFPRVRGEMLRKFLGLEEQK